MQGRKHYSFCVVLIAGFSLLFCLMANIVSGRLGFFGKFIAPMGVFFFPFIYVLSDITSDVYGYRISRYIAWLTSLSNIIFVFGILSVLKIIKCAPFCQSLEDSLLFVLIGGSGTTGMMRVMFAGLAGSVFGGWINDIIFQIYRHIDGENKGFAKRKLLSSAAAEAVDTMTFITLAFIGTPSWSIQMYFVQYILKYSVEVITEPAAHWLAKNIRTYEEPDVFEDRNKFNIFGIYKKA